MWIFHVSTFATLIWLRKTMPIAENPRLFKVPIGLAFLACAIGFYLILVPFMDLTSNPLGYLFAILWIVFGVGLYLISTTKICRDRFEILSEKCTRFLQLLLQVVTEDKSD